MAEEKQHHFGFLHKKDDEGEQVKEKKQHKHIGKAAALGAAAAGAYTLHEKRAAKKNEDPEESHKHKIKEEVAAVVALGAAGLALHQHHEKKAAAKRDE
uniref:Uncharacterized protein n=1 Tax=Kalanchoe fedtschenkoi TaxID=63787 RepID=A0A7N0VGU4_KALFE